MPGEENEKTESGEKSWNAEPWRLELDPRADHSAGEEQRREKGDPDCQPLEPGRLDAAHLALEPRLFHQILDRLGDARGEDRPPVDLSHSLLRAQAQQLVFFAVSLPTQLEHPAFVDERVGNFGAVPVFLGSAAGERAHRGYGFGAHRLAQVLASSAHGRRGANETHGRHIHMLRRDGDESPGGERLVIDEGIRGDIRAHERLHDVHHGVDRAARRVDVEDHRLGFLPRGVFQCAAHENELRLGHRPLDRDHHDFGRRGPRHGED